MISIDVVSLVKAVTEADGMLTKNEERLIIGRNDKKIGLIDSSGNLITLKEPTNFSLQGTETDVYRGGRLSIPTNSGEFIVHWGHTVVQANSNQVYNFASPFPNACFFIIGGQRENDAVTGMQIANISKTQYNISIVGGVGSEIVSWIALGM